MSQSRISSLCPVVRCAAPFGNPLAATTAAKVEAAAKAEAGAKAKAEARAAAKAKTEADAKAAADAKAKATADKLTADAQTADPSKVGYLIANTEPWARVVIDGKDTGMMTPIAPRSKIPLKPGKHTVTFVIDGQKFKFGIVIVAGEDYRLIKTLEVAAP